MTIKVETNMSNKDYHQGPGLSASGIKEFLISPAHYLEAKNRPFDESVKLESLVHLFILEPHTFDDNYAIVGDRRTKAGKEAYAKAVESGKLVVKEDEVSQAKTIAGNVLQNPELNDIFTSGKNECSVFVQDENLDIALKIRPDVLLEDRKTIVDIKTVSRGMNKFTLENLVRARGWDLQAAFYLHVAKQAFKADFDFIHVFIEKDAPYGVRVMKINDASINTALTEILPALVEYKDCMATSTWPNYSGVIEEMNIRKYKTEDEAFL